MRQYHRFKQRHPGCVLFFRMGDFYEMFEDDAHLAHRVLGVTLTQRTEGIPMAGVPYHAVEGYIRRMIQAGHRVAVCDQTEDPAQAKGLVQRQVTRVVTPGTLTDEALLDEGKENPLAAVMFRDDQHAALAWAELSTGAFSLADLDASALGDELARIAPRELLYVETANRQPPPRVAALVEGLDCACVARPAWQFRQREALETLGKQFGVASLAGFGLADDHPALGPASAVIHYLLETQCPQESEETGSQGSARFCEPRLNTAGEGAKALPPSALAHLRPPRVFARNQFLVIDQTSLRSLEVEQTMRSGSTQGSLLGVLLGAGNAGDTSGGGSGGGCRTAMGKRQLRQWLCYPLCDRPAIEARQRVVGALVDDSRFLDGLRALLDQVQDVPRLIGRLSVGRALPRDLVALGRSCAPAGALTGMLADRPAVEGYHQRLTATASALTELAERIAQACVDAPPNHLREGGMFRDGFDTRLDEYRGLLHDSNTWLARYQKELIDQTGIASLKVGFNQVFGYYIELTAANRERASAGWARKQTLKNAERFITPELKEYEGRVLSAQQRAIAREQELFAELSAAAQQRIGAMQAFAEVVGELDVLACFARRAIRLRYVRPRIVDEPVLMIRGGRHPVLDELLGDRFVPNDLALGVAAPPETPLPEPPPPEPPESPEPPEGAEASAGTGGASLALITGPNMAGKSTYIRQAALLTLLAHTGSFVPADEAVIGLCDRIFTRIGASDELHLGQSTFMVEMTETANICHHAGPSSLVILDEIGRGTSTLDGLALAWAIAEHLAQRRCRTLFATHYHELTSLAEQYPNVANLHVTVREWADTIVFLHRIAAGRTDRSYGIHVAKIAGLPAEVVARANDLLGQLAVSHDAGATLPGPHPGAGAAAGKGPPTGQMALFTEYLEHPALEDLRQADLNRLSPLEAFDLLRRLRARLDGGPKPTPSQG
jgi:DNA mismatch repair protein MutS